MKSYPLQGTPAAKGYKGCGHGILIVEKKNDIPIKMFYGIYELSAEQNINMCKEGGKILDETEDYITYIANFSCYEACLF